MLVLEQPRDLVRHDVDLPEPVVGGALVRIEACGLCGTDHEQYTGVLPGPGPFVPGHEIVGTVESLGPGGGDRLGVAEGDRVAVEVFRSCRECEPCRAGDYRHCARHGLGDMVGFVPAARDHGLWGGYATHLMAEPDTLLLPVPAGLDPVTATLFNPLGAGIRWAVTVPRTRPGDVVAVLGPGIRGLCAAVAAKEAGAGFVMITGVGPGDDDRLAVAPRFGADLAVDVAVDDPVAALAAATGGHADVVVDVTAKAPDALGHAVRLARPGGTVVVAGTRGSSETPGFQPDLIVFKELTIQGALGVDAAAYRAALDLLAADRWPFADLPRRVVDLDHAADLLAVLAGDADGGRPVHAVIRPELPEPS